MFCRLVLINILVKASVVSQKYVQILKDYRIIQYARKQIRIYFSVKF